MSKRKLILWLGVLVALLPFLGLPASWKTVIYLVAGVSIAWNSWELNKHKAIRPRRAARRAATAASVENAASSPVAAPFAPAPPAEKKEEKITVVS
ncbi:MAG: hypothetical protein Q8Q36_01850 [bacterium]|nr:hypothetical protein [bacterium]